LTVPRIGFGTAALGTKAGSVIKSALDYGNNYCPALALNFSNES